ncbi:hypothetical protein [Actomonas aquatica]|uniref:Haemin-degrading HemS/ChuX domain-containing protein n=1 Tax=Actomonas aquatica TaxID=2866162 RepID=A0ABZ1C9A4_9BACT|nr:hypothetical protein [Opitutus sp. WL0086]WRQ86895.1 hypothetical protein K1X11_018945 [Opitutus sp. WL0086]
MFSRFSAHPSSPSATTSARLSRCFATTADGRIPLTLDWPRHFQRLGEEPRLALQTRHARARLISLGPFPVGDTISGDFQRPDCRLRFHYHNWSNVWAQLSPCDCCGSPGRIDFINTHGAEFMQVCAAPDAPAIAWALLLGTLAERTPAELPELPAAPFSSYELPRLPRRAWALEASPAAISEFLQQLGADPQPVTVCLHTGDVFHHRVFVPAAVSCDPHLLQAGDRRTTVQLAHHNALHPHLEASTRGLWLHLADATGSILLSLGPGDAEGPARAAWDHTLHQRFNL